MWTVRSDHELGSWIDLRSRHREAQAESSSFVQRAADRVPLAKSGQKSRKQLRVGELEPG
jgi:hypothetical protein